METRYANELSTLSVRTLVLSMVLFTGGAVVVSTFGNPLAVMLPVTGAISAGGLIWTIDKIQAGITICIPRTGRCWRTGTN
jgi:hypothetical protein